MKVSLFLNKQQVLIDGGRHGVVLTVIFGNVLGGGVEHIDANAHILYGGIAEYGIGIYVHFLVDPFSHSIVEGGSVAVGCALCSF